MNMKKAILLSMLSLSVVACDKVPAGNVGVKVYLLGSEKGVDHEVLGPGRYWIGVNEDLYLFPTYTQTHTYDKEQAINFQTKEGLVVSGDIGVTYHVDKDKVAEVFQRYRKGVEEITDVFLRNIIRDQFNNVASTLSVESIYGMGKSAMLVEVTKRVQSQVGQTGIVVENIYVVGNFVLPPEVTNAINAKLTATQLAQQRENEIQTARAEAEKIRVAAQGRADAELIAARAQAQANKLLTESITGELVNYQAVQKWNGVMPLSTGTGALPLMNLK